MRARVPAAGSKANGALRRLRGIGSPDPLESPKVIQRTREFLRFRQRALADDVGAAVRLGKILNTTRHDIQGHFMRWLARLEISRETAHNFMALSGLAVAHPELVKRLAVLGSFKLYRAARLSAAGHQRLMRTSVEQLARLSQQKFASFTAAYLPKRHSATTNQRAHGLDMKLRAWAEQLRASRVTKVDDPHLRQRLRRDLGTLRQAADALIRRL